MTKGTDAGMTNLNHLTGLLHPTQQRVEIVRWQRWASCQGDCSGIDEADGDKILLGVERVIRIKRHAGRQRVLMQQDRVAVGLRTRGFGGGNHAASAADVFYHDRLTE